jgi:hypothetical protein
MRLLFLIFKILHAGGGPEIVRKLGNFALAASWLHAGAIMNF